MKVKETNVKGKGKSSDQNYMSDEEAFQIDVMAELDEQVLRKYELAFNHHKMIGRIVVDEAHLIKNPCTLGADAIYKLQIPKTALITGTPIINRINDARGLLIQLMKVKELPLILPKTPQGLVSMYDSTFNPLRDLPNEAGSIQAQSILPARDGTDLVEKVYKAAEAGEPLHIMCPGAFLSVGNQSDWEPKTARAVLRPILNTIQRKRLMSHSFETVNGQVEIPGRGIPHYTVRTIRLKMPKAHARFYKETTAEWLKKIYMPNVTGRPITSVKTANAEATGALNMEAFRGLQLSTFDGQLTKLVKRKVKSVPVGTAKEVRTWYERDDDHGISMKYYRTRPEEAWYIPLDTNRLQAALTSMGLSPKMKALVLQIAEWKEKGERCLAFFNWPQAQW